MKTESHRRVSNGLLGRAAFGLLAVAATLCLAGEARAQWTAPDAAGNITTTGTGNVGIGAAKAPAAILDAQRAETTDLLMRLWNTSTAGGTATFRIANSSNAGSRLQFTDSTSYVSSIFADRTGGLRFRTGNASSEAALGDRMTITPAGNVGIGTTTPLGVLNVPYGEVIIGQNYYQGATLRVGRNDANLPGIVTATNYNDGSKPVYRARSFDPASLAGDGVYTFMAQNALQQRTFSADHRGNGYFAGDLTVGGNIAAKYQDVAEWVPSKQKLSAGTVVVLDTAELNHVQTSGKSYDTAVAGVISAQPGIALGEKGEGKVLVATTGRVKVKVDATRGAIKVGDLLVTSDVAGVAMKSQPLELGGVPIHRPGTIIGKALEPLEKGTGEILVLLSLQ